MNNHRFGAIKRVFEPYVVFIRGNSTLFCINEREGKVKNGIIILLREEEFGKQLMF
jgi:hypothetical protein